jgi:HAD superfamily hydrolase (TIGR01490 family)
MTGSSESTDASLTGTTLAPAISKPSLLSPSAALQGASVAAFFDVDNTIIRGASSFHLAKALYRRGFFGTRDILAFAVKQGRYLLFGENDGDIADVRSRALGLMKGHSVAEVIAVGEEVYDQVLANRIYEGTKRLLDQHLSAGHQVWLITATPAEAGELIARRLGATGALCTRVESVDGFYTGRLEGEMMHGKSKATSAGALAESHGIDLTESFAYGDSTNDIPLLNLVGNPCAINPDSRMRKHAQTVGWPIRDFRGKRRVARRSLTTASMTGGLWVAVLVIKRLLSRSK